jgi:hypothetical protein
MRVEKGVVIGTPLGKTVLIEYVYRGCWVKIGDVEMRVDLLPLDLYDFGNGLASNIQSPNRLFY